MSVIGTIHEDITTDVLGVIGSWQWLVTFITTACMIFPVNQYENAFLLEPPRMAECIRPLMKNATILTLCPTEYTNETHVECLKWRVRCLGFFWIKKSWVMFCNPEIKILSTSIISRLGSIFGCIIFGVIADSFGRKLTIKLNVVIEICLRAILIFCDSESWFHLLIFLKSLFAGGITYMGIVIICEIASNKWRTQLTAIVSLPRVLAAICLTSIANLVPTAETFDLIACVCGVLHFIFLRWVPESPQWFLYNGRIPSTEKLLTKAAKRNGNVLGSIFKIRPADHQTYIILDETRSCIEFLTTYNIQILTLTITSFWCLHSFLWSTLYLRVFYHSEERIGVLKLLCLLIGMSILNISLFKKLILRKLVMMNLIIIVLLEALLMILHCLMIQGTITNIISLLSLSTGVVVQMLLLNITPRLLAINVRATLFGVCHSAGQLATIVCYIVVLLNAIDSISLMITNITLTITLLALCHILPDVDRRELPDVLQDMDYFSELSKPLRWAAQKTTSPSHEEIEMRVYSFNSAIQNTSTKSHSAERLPARKIGFVPHWRSAIKLFKIWRK